MPTNPTTPEGTTRRLCGAVLWSTVGAPAGLDPVVGDVAYYAPLNHLVFFAGDNVFADGLVRMGRVDTGLAALQRPGRAH